MNREEYYKIEVPCPKCSGTMRYTGGLLGWECDKCDFESEIEFDSINNTYYAVDSDEMSEDDILNNPDDMPECCISCSGAYPDCVKSCDIFDD